MGRSNRTCDNKILERSPLLLSFRKGGVHQRLILLFVCVRSQAEILFCFLLNLTLVSSLRNNVFDQGRVLHPTKILDE